MTLRVDHVAIAGPDLDRMRHAFASAGLETVYGGKHGDGRTHMALLGFEDGSYIELISLVDLADSDTLFWRDFILAGAGPCGWAARCDDVDAEAARISASGIRVDGPIECARLRPDGQEVRWKLAVLGDARIGTVLAFLIQDLTPRERRVSPSPSVAGGPLRGVATVVIGVEELALAVELFRSAYGWAEPQLQEDERFGATLAHFSGSPVTLAAPLAQDGWLKERVQRFGPAPAAYLLETRDMRDAAERYALQHPTTWFGHSIAWFDGRYMEGIRLGVAARRA